MIARIGAVEGALSIIGSFMRFCHLEKLVGKKLEKLSDISMYPKYYNL